MNDLKRLEAIAAEASQEASEAARALTETKEAGAAAAAIAQIRIRRAQDRVERANVDAKVAEAVVAGGDLIIAAQRDKALSKELESL